MSARVSACLYVRLHVCRFIILLSKCNSPRKMKKDCGLCEALWSKERSLEGILSLAHCYCFSYWMVWQLCYPRRVFITGIDRSHFPLESHLLVPIAPTWPILLAASKPPPPNNITFQQDWGLPFSSSVRTSCNAKVSLSLSLSLEEREKSKKEKDHWSLQMWPGPAT